MQDAQGQDITVASEASARAFDHVIEGFLKYRFDTGLRLKAFRTADPTAPLGQVMAGCFAMLAYDRAMVPRAEAAVTAAEAMPANARERAHMAALRAWVEGAPDRALSIWEGIVAEHPRDLLAFRLHHFCAFWMGAPARMLTLVEQVLPLGQRRQRLRLCRLNPQSPQWPRWCLRQRWLSGHRRPAMGLHSTLYRFPARTVDRRI